MISRLNAKQSAGLPPLRAITEAPIVNATETSVYSVLKDLLDHPERRAKLASRSREFAISWYGSEACAKRYETVIERVRMGVAPEADDLYPAKSES